MTIFKMTRVHQQSGFTLIELVLVMLLMVILISLVFPSLKGFFRGRNLDNEALRFLALTRYGQSRAVTEGVPVELWINPKAGSYGLEALSGYSETQTKSMTYNVDSTIQISFSAPSSVLVRSNYWSQAKGQMGAVARIRFQPDGFISDASPATIYMRQSDGQVSIAETPTHLQYDIQTGQFRR
ncbi:MAG TPA: GspH/FimT family pseudopilin [Verrucomicrobiae bacterium]|jgi:type II secretion system protein H